MQKLKVIFFWIRLCCIKSFLAEMYRQCLIMHGDSRGLVIISKWRYQAQVTQILQSIAGPSIN